MAKDLKNTDKKKLGKELKGELKKVVWPKPAELAKSTLAVIAIVVVIGVIVFCLDFVFESMNKYGIDKIAEKVQGTGENTTAEESSSEENSDEENSDEENPEESNDDSSSEENATGEETSENQAEGETTENQAVEENNVQE